jgi:hypothetical protein
MKDHLPRLAGEPIQHRGAPEVFGDVKLCAGTLAAAPVRTKSAPVQHAADQAVTSGFRRLASTFTPGPMVDDTEIFLR